MPVLTEGALHIHKIENMGPYGNNGYLVVDPAAREAIIVDAPAEPEKLLAEVGDLRVRAILITHRHQDHWFGLGKLAELTGATAYAQSEDVEGIKTPTRPFRNGRTFEVGTGTVTVIHTPGHTPGASCFLLGGHIFTGDTLFQGGPGATRTPTHLAQIIKSINAKLFTLPDDTVVLTGHGPNTTIGAAKAEYRVFASKSHPAELCGDVLWLKS